jgi:hypothetical protein
MMQDPRPWGRQHHLRCWHREGGTCEPRCLRRDGMQLDSSARHIRRHKTTRAGSESSTPIANSNWLNASVFTRLSTIPASSPYCIGGPRTPAETQLSRAERRVPFSPGAGIGYGNSKVGSILGPGQFNFDMALLKNTKITEALTLQFRVEAFDIWNHAQFNQLR